MTIDDLPPFVTASITNLARADEGWWHTSGEEEFQRIAVALLNVGFSQEQTTDMLTSAYVAVAAEYGE